MKLAMGHIQDIGSIWTGHTWHTEMRTSNLSENILADGLWAFEARYSVDELWLAFVPRSLADNYHGDKIVLSLAHQYINISVEIPCHF